jgi:hypothetical protein
MMALLEKGKERTQVVTNSRVMKKKTPDHCTIIHEVV